MKNVSSLQKNASFIFIGLQCRLGQASNADTSRVVTLLVVSCFVLGKCLALMRDTNCDRYAWFVHHFVTSASQATASILPVLLFVDVFEMGPSEVIALCKECVLSEDEEPYEVRNDCARNVFDRKVRNHVIFQRLSMLRRYNNNMRKQKKHQFNSIRPHLLF